MFIVQATGALVKTLHFLHNLHSAQHARALNYTRPVRLASDKQTSLFGTLIRNEGNEVFRNTYVISMSPFYMET
jgi:hypothetical protein